VTCGTEGKYKKNELTFLQSEIHSSSLKIKKHLDIILYLIN